MTLAKIAKDAKKGAIGAIPPLCHLALARSNSYFLLAQSAILLPQASSEALFYLNLVPAKPDTFASFAIFARVIPFFPLSTSVFSEFSVVFYYPCLFVLSDLSERLRNPVFPCICR